MGMVSPKDFVGRDVLSILDFNREELDYIMDVADEVERNMDAYRGLLSGKTMAILFFEPSTRTRLSFEAAMKKLGGLTLDMGEPTRASIEKGETLTDTIRVVQNYADLIVLRHPKEGAAKLAAEVADIPVINGGSGAEEHPTQAMLDLYTIRRCKKRIDGLRIGILGDLKYGRTTHSLAYALSNYDVKLYLVSPELLRMRREVLRHISGRIEVQELESIDQVLPELDVLYVTRIQKERFVDESEYLKVKGSYRVTIDTLSKMKKDAIIMHPLPRVDEIAIEVDSTPNAVYFKQVYYGLLTRMSIISLVLGALSGK
ncbi:MAG: aspartate carbamoyltransferase [Candidatus Bathyarchaeia archaeon]